jgi:hypothetical protein
MLSHEHVLLERERRVVLARLDALLRLPQGTTLPPPPADLDRAAVVTPDDSTAARAARKWPEVLAADLRVEAARRQLDLARRQRWPEPTVSVVPRCVLEPAWRTSGAGAEPAARRPGAATRSARRPPGSKPRGRPRR